MEHSSDQIALILIRTIMMINSPFQPPLDRASADSPIVEIADKSVCHQPAGVVVAELNHILFRTL